MLVRVGARARVSDLEIQDLDCTEHDRTLPDVPSTHNFRPSFSMWNYKRHEENKNGIDHPSCFFVFIPFFENFHLSLCTI